MLRHINRLFHRQGKFSLYHKLNSWENEAKTYLLSFMANHGRLTSSKPRMIDFGSGDGKFVRCLIKDIVEEIELFSLDVEDLGLPNTILHDANTPIEPKWHEQFDLVFSSDAMEHFREPGIAADNMSRMLRPQGMLLVSTIFAWRYHPVPKDYYRFTDDGLRYLFAERNSLMELSCGYDISRRRENIVGGFFGDKDIPPLDLLGGFRENWRVFFVGKKTRSGE